MTTRAAAPATSADGGIVENNSNGNDNPNNNDDDVIDVTETSLKGRNSVKEVIEILDSSSSSSDSSDYDDDDDDDDDDDFDSDYDYNDKNNYKNRSRSQNNLKRKRTEISPIEVRLNAKDVPIAPGQHHGAADESKEFQQGTTLSSAAAANNVSSEVKSRIVKMLNMAMKPDGNENEAKKAMKLARREMQKHNLQQFELLQEAKTEEAESLRGGYVTLKCFNSRTDELLPKMPRWISFLMNPVGDNFDVKSFKRRTYSGPKHSFEIVFYGLYLNCQVAAWAMKVAIEKIALMMANHSPASHEVCTLPQAKLSYGEFYQIPPRR